MAVLNIDQDVTLGIPLESISHQIAGWVRQRQFNTSGNRKRIYLVGMKHPEFSTNNFIRQCNGKSDQFCT
jgi:hypothetical protein